MFRRFSVWRLVGGLIKLLFYGLIAFMVCFLLFRVIAHNTDPGEIKTLTCDSDLVEAYREYGKDLTLYTQSQLPYTNAERNSGYFYVRRHVIIPQAHEIQVVFRYSDTTLKKLTQDYGVSPEALPDPDGQVYDVSLVIKRDLTPEDKTDSNEKGTYELIRVAPGSETALSRGRYHYRRYVFNQVDIDEDTLAVFLDVYYAGDVDYDDPAYGTLCLWDAGSPDNPRQLTAADRRALKKALGE